MMVVGQFIVRLIQIEVMHDRFGVCFLGRNHFRKKFVLTRQTFDDDIPGIQLVSHDRIRSTVDIDPLLGGQFNQIVSITARIMPVEIRVFGF